VAADDFWPSYRTTARLDDELLIRIRIPAVADRHVRFRKVGTRRAQAISKLVMALAWRSSDDAPWADVRLALGSVAATTVRARAAEAAMQGRRPDRETADAATAALVDEIVPIDDVRSTADYRRAVAARVLHRLVRDAGGW
jgi:xanthine dehydrogenase small subunit